MCEYRTEQLWFSFLKEWGDQYENARLIISYLRTYSETLEKIHLASLIDLEDIEKVHNEWVWLYSKLDHELERDFFKPFWIPIQEDSYDYFMDISNNNFPIFEVNFFFFEPYRWYKKYLVENISDLMLAEDTSIDIPKLLKENDQKRWRIVNEFFAERKRLGLDGK